MHVAASEGKVEVLKLLVTKGADVNPEDRWQRTPLSDALEHRHEDVHLILLDETWLLGLKRHIQAVVYLESVGARAKMKVTDIISQLCNASAKGDLPVVERLINMGLDPNTSVCNSIEEKLKNGAHQYFRTMMAELHYTLLPPRAISSRHYLCIFVRASGLLTATLDL